MDTGSGSTWALSAFVCAFVIASGVTNASTGVPTLPTPSTLTVKLRSESEVVLHWDFATPGDVSLRDVEFCLLLVLGDGHWQPTRRFYPRPHPRSPFEYTVSNLLPGAEYTAFLSATSPGWKQSGNVSTSFVTRHAEMPAPSITNVVKSIRVNFVEYLIHWTIKPSSHLLDHFEIHVCDEYCFLYTRNSTESQLRVPALFKSSVSIEVLACYMGGTGFVKKVSSTFTGAPEDGGSGTPPNVRAIKMDNRIRLEWHPPHHPMGPISYYDVSACDPSLLLDEKAQNTTTDSSVIFNYRFLTGSAYELLDDIDEDTGIDLGGGHERQKHDASERLQLVVVKKIPNCIRFKIVFQKPKLENFFDVDTDMKQLQLGPGVTDSFDMTPYERVEFKIRNCVTSQTYINGPESNADRCGRYAEFEILSNVAAPSAVKSLQLYIRNFFMAVLTWEPPEVRRGPIDGYQIVIEITSWTVREIRDITLNSTDQTFIIKDYDPEYEYVFGVAAFNLDLENRTVRHVGDWMYVQPPDRQSAIVSRWAALFVFFVVAVGFVVVFTILENRQRQNQLQQDQ